MAKARTKSRWARTFGRGLVRTFRTLDSAAERIVNRPQKQMRHGKLEWGKDKDGRPVHFDKVAAYPTRVRTRQPVKWASAHMQEDRQLWRATFDTGVTVDFETWPVGRTELERLAHEERSRKYGVYSDDWPLNGLTLLGTMGADETDDEGE